MAARRDFSVTSESEPRRWIDRLSAATKLEIKLTRTALCGAYNADARRAREGVADVRIHTVETCVHRVVMVTVVKDHRQAVVGVQVGEDDPPRRYAPRGRAPDRG